VFNFAGFVVLDPGVEILVAEDAMLIGRSRKID
jgi:hypothetical protein